MSRMPKNQASGIRNQAAANMRLETDRKQKPRVNEQSDRVYQRYVEDRERHYAKRPAAREPRDQDFQLTGRIPKQDLMSTQRFSPREMEMELRRSEMWRSQSMSDTQRMGARRTDDTRRMDDAQRMSDTARMGWDDPLRDTDRMASAPRRSDVRRMNEAQRMGDTQRMSDARRMRDTQRMESTSRMGRGDMCRDTARMERTSRMGDGHRMNDTQRMGITQRVEGTRHTENMPRDAFGQTRLNPTVRISPEQAARNELKANKTSKIMMYMTCALLLTLMFVQIGRLAQIAAQTKQIAAINSNLRELDIERNNREVRLSMAQNINNVKKEAINRLGMVYPEDGQIRVIALSQSEPSRTQTADNSGALEGTN